MAVLFPTTTSAAERLPYELTYDGKVYKGFEGVIDVYSLKTTFKGSAPILRGCLGDHDNYYSQYCRDLTKEKKITFTSTSGRATHIQFPYFDLVHGDGGS